MEDLIASMMNIVPCEHRTLDVGDVLFWRKLNTLKDGVLTVKAYTGFYPVCYKDTSGKLRGVDVDIMTRFSECTNLKVEFIETEKFDDVWTAPMKGEADIAIGGIGITKDRINALTAWTVPYYYLHRSMVYNQAHPIESIESLHSILATKGSTGWQDAYARLEQVGAEHLLKEGSTEEQDIRDLIDGKVQGLMRGSVAANVIAKRHPELAVMACWDILPGLVTSDGECFAFPTHVSSGVAVALSTLLGLFMSDGQLEIILKHHKV